jgi:excisionase family DNA binding protein
MSSELLSTNEAAAALQVGASTVKRWADEGRLRCVKTAGGHRRFHRNDVADMLSSGLMADSEMSAQQILEDIDGHATLSLLYQLRARYGAWWVVAERVASFLHQVGEDWATGKLSIIEEHTISERLVRALSSTCQVLPAAIDAPICLFVMVEGDDHTLGLRLAELVAREAGWRSQWVGRNTPLIELSEVLVSDSIQAVAASASAFSADEKVLARQVRSLEALTEAAKVPLALGGDGAWPEHPGYGKRIGDFDAFRNFLLASMSKR